MTIHLAYRWWFKDGPKIRPSPMCSGCLVGVAVAARANLCGLRIFLPTKTLAVDNKVIFYAIKSSNSLWTQISRDPGTSEGP